MNKLKFVVIGLMLFLAMSNLSAQAYLVTFDEENTGANTTFPLKSLNLSTGNLTYIGTSFPMKDYYAMGEIHYNKATNEIVALYSSNNDDSKNIWAYNLTTNAQRTIQLDGKYYRSMTTDDEKCYLMTFDENNAGSNTIFQLKSLDLSTGSLTHIGNSFPMKDYYAMGEIHYNKATNEIVALYSSNNDDSKNIWAYNLTTNAQRTIQLDGKYYRSMTIDDEKCYLMTFDENNVGSHTIFQLKSLDLTTSDLTHIGYSLPMQDYYALGNIHYNKSTNEILALQSVNTNNDNIWAYNLTTNTQRTIQLDGNYYRSITINNNDTGLTGFNDIELTKKPVSFYNLMGIRLQNEPENGAYIILYDNGLAEKVVR